VLGTIVAAGLSGTDAERVALAHRSLPPGATAFIGIATADLEPSRGVGVAIHDGEDLGF
jgi:hypothetical protein